MSNHHENHDYNNARPIMTVPYLTDREVESLRLMARGKTNKEIAHDLGLKESTVKNMNVVIMRSLSAADRAQAVYNGVRAGYIAIE